MTTIRKPFPTAGWSPSPASPGLSPPPPRPARREYYMAGAGRRRGCLWLRVPRPAGGRGDTRRPSVSVCVRCRQHHRRRPGHACRSVAFDQCARSLGRARHYRWRTVPRRPSIRRLVVRRDPVRRAPVRLENSHVKRHRAMSYIYIYLCISDGSTALERYEGCMTHAGCGSVRHKVVYGVAKCNNKVTWNGMATERHGPSGTTCRVQLGYR